MIINIKRGERFSLSYTDRSGGRRASAILEISRFVFVSGIVRVRVRVWVMVREGVRVRVRICGVLQIFRSLFIDDLNNVSVGQVKGILGLGSADVRVGPKADQLPHRLRTDKKNRG